MTARSFSTPPSSKVMSQPMKATQTGPTRKAHTTKGRPKGSKNLGRKAYPTQDNQREIRFKVLTGETLFEPSRSPVSPVESPQPSASNTPELSTRSARSSQSYSSPYLPSQAQRASSTEGLVQRMDGFSTQSPETCYSEDLFSHFNPSSGSMSHVELMSAPTSAGDQGNVDTSLNYPPDWDGYQQNQQLQFDSWLSGLPLDDLQNDNKLSTDVSHGENVQNTNAMNYMMGVQREIHHLTNLIIPEATKELAQAKDWQRHCLEIYEDSSRAVRQVEQKMTAIRQQYEAKMAAAASTKQDLNGLLSVQTSQTDPCEPQRRLS